MRVYVLSLFDHERAENLTIAVYVLEYYYPARIMYS